MIAQILDFKEQMKHQSSPFFGYEPDSLPSYKIYLNHVLNTKLGRRFATCTVTVEDRQNTNSMIRNSLIIAILFLFVVSLQAQGSYKIVFDEPKSGLFTALVANSDDEFVGSKSVYPFQTLKVIESEIYSFSNSSPYDTLRWDIELSHADTAIFVSTIYCFPENGEYLFLGNGTHYTNTDTLIIVSKFNWMMKLDAAKNKIWEAYYPIPEEISQTSGFYGVCMLPLTSGNYLLGRTISVNPAVLHLQLIEINPEGDVVKSKLFDDSQLGIIMSLTYDMQGSSILLHLVAGQQLNNCQSGTGAYILDTANYDITGSICYNENGAGFDEPFNAMISPNGELIVAGSYRSFNSSNNSINRYLGVARYDTSYQITNQILLTAPDTMTYAAWEDCIDINEQGEICVAASFDNALGFYTGYYDLIYLAKLDSELNLMHERYIGRDAEYAPYYVAATGDGGIAIGGSQYDYLVNQYGEEDPFIIKTDAGLWVDTPKLLEEDIRRALVYPNPGTSELNIRTTVKQAVFRLYDINGHVILECSINQLTTTMPVGYLSKGAYWWTITQHENVSDRGKWIKL